MTRDDGTTLALVPADLDSDTGTAPGRPAESTSGSPAQRPLTARSVLASVLLGSEPAVLPVHALVRVGAIFGLAEGTVRTALSRMAAAGELVHHDDGHYELAGPLVERQERQRTGRSAQVPDWSGAWDVRVVLPGARSTIERADLRRAASVLRLAELRDGVWLRPDNLDTRRFPVATATMAGQCQHLSAHPDHDVELAARLWDLAGWTDTARDLRRRMAALAERIGSGDTTALRPGFELSAAVLRHFNQDPLLPRELLPRRWEGSHLRADYDRWDAAYRTLLRTWLRAT